MSFLFNWRELSILNIKDTCNSLLGSISVPQFPQRVSIKSLTFGDVVPTFELLDVIELDVSKFKGLFKFNYQGDSNVVFNTNFEINSLKLIEFDSFTKPKFVLSDKSTIVPVDFEIKNLRIDGIMTVVYDGRITVVFRDDPLIDLDIETSFDDLLDADLFELIKQHALKIAVELVKQDLPEYLHSLSLFEDMNQQSKDQQSQDEEPDLKRSYSLLSLTDQNIIQDMNELFNTFSLIPKGFPDVVQRVTLSEYQGLESKPAVGLGIKKRRVIKMNKINRKLRDQENFTQSDQPDKKTLKANSLESEASSTLIDTSFQTQTIVDDYLHHDYTLLQSESPDNSPDNSLDPYESITHPLDLAPVYSEDSSNLKLKFERPRGPSSNYINLNSEFMDFKRTLKDENILDYNFS